VYDASGENVRLELFDGALDAATRTRIDVPGVGATPESKSGLAWIASGGKNLYAVSANRNGVAIVDAESGNLLTTIPAPDLSTVKPENQASNSVSTGTASDKATFFIANGEAGLYVGDLDLIGDAEASWGIAGTIRFGEGQSVNYASSKNNVVVAATGTGGLKILELAAK